jgi:hypothetical protein
MRTNNGVMDGRRAGGLRVGGVVLAAIALIAVATPVPVRAAGSSPIIAADAPSVTVDENHLAKAFGDWSDPDGDAVTVSASVGSVDTYPGGRWEWSYPAMDGPFDEVVTLTATDATAATATVDVALHVNNVAPTGWTQGPAFVPVGSASARSFLWSVVDVPGDNPAIDVGCGSGTAVGSGDGQVNGTNWIRCTFPAAGTTKVGPQATDKDGAAVDARKTVVATTAVRSVADGRLVIDGAAEHDYVGSALAAVDLDHDGRSDVAIGSSAPMHEVASDPGVIHVVRGRTDAASLNLGAMPAGSSWTITGPPDVRFGHALAAAGDVNGDGIDDLLVGSLAGAWVVYGKAGFTSVDVRSMAPARGFAITGLASPAGAPFVSGVGDVNGDGYDDVAVASPDVDSGDGEVAVILGRANPTDVDAGAIPTGRGFIIGATPLETGWSIAGGDVNGDGRSDVVVASPFGWDSNALVVFGRATPVNVDQATMTAAQGFVIGGGDGLGVQAVAVGDMDRDGFADVAVAHAWTGNLDGWEVTIVRGGATNASVVDLSAGAGRVFRVDTGAAGDPTRLAMADVTGDGRADLLLGIPFAASNDSNAGSAYVLKGSATLANVSFDLLDARWSRVDGDLGYALAGSGIAAGDVNGDRIADLLVGAEGATNWAEVDQGRVAMFAGLRVSDTAAPVVAEPAVRLATGSVHPLVPVAITWGAIDRTSGVVHYDVQRQADGGPWVTIGSVGVTSAATRSLASGHTYRIRVRAIDGAGNRSGWKYGVTFRLSAYGDASSRILYRGTWRLASSTAWWGGTARYAKGDGARATLTFTGRNVAWIAAKGPDRGKARVFVNGVLVQTLDLRASTSTAAAVVFRRSWTSSATRTIRIEVLGTAGRPRVDLDGFVVLR